MNSRRSLLFFLAFFAFLKVNATHIVGGEMNYTFQGGGIYEIRLRVYRDCANSTTQFDNPAIIAVYSADGSTLISTISVNYRSIQSVPNAINSPCLSPPTNVCYEVAEYVATTSLPPRVGGYVLAYQRCCRNNSINNIISPQSSGATYIATVPGSEVVTVNSNPVFSKLPPTFICKDAPFTFDHSAIDPDGDSLVYQLYSPLLGADQANPRPNPPSSPPYDSVTFRSPYSLSNMLGGVAMVINSENGTLTATPNFLGQFVYGVKVLEYRNGILIGATLRDFQVNVISCPQITVASIFSPTIACGSLTADFVNTSYNAAAYQWFFGDSLTLGDTSNARNPSYTYPDTGTYTVTLVAFSGINVGCNDTTTGTVFVYPQFLSDFSTSNVHCTPDFSFTDQSYGSGGAPNFWLWTFGDNTFSTQQNPQHIYSSPGTYNVTLISSTDSACYDTLVKQIYVLQNPIASFLTTLDTCSYKLNIRNTSAYNATNIWNFGDNQIGYDRQGIHQYLNPGTYTISLEVNTDSMCMDTASATIFIPPLPTASFTYAYPPCDSTVTFTNNSQLSVAWNWQFGDGDTSSLFEPVHTYSLGGKIPVTLTAISSYGCEVPFTDSIFVLSRKEADFTAAIDSCSGIVSFSNVTMYAPSYLWQFGDGTTSTEQFPLHVFPQTASYPITLVVNPETACADQVTKTFNNEKPLGELLYVPNSFTPNGDGVNDVFKIFSFRPCYTYALIIYNRWGQKIYEVNDALNANWDGTYEGGQCQNDIYVYLLRGNDQERKGFINLLR